MEVISLESRQRDSVDKLQEYARGGVPEYWLMDYENQHSRFYFLDEHGVYQEIPVDNDHIFRSRILPGLWLDTRWLWQRPLPTVRDVLRAWGL